MTDDGRPLPAVQAQRFSEAATTARLDRLWPPVDDRAALAAVRRLGDGGDKTLLDVSMHVEVGR